MERPPNDFRVDKPAVRGPGGCGEFASAWWSLALPSQWQANAASAQPPHMSMKLSISRTTSFPVYSRKYPSFGATYNRISAVADDRGIDQFGEHPRTRGAG